MHGCIICAHYSLLWTNERQLFKINTNGQKHLTPMVRAGYNVISVSYIVVEPTQRQWLTERPATELVNVSDQEVTELPKEKLDEELSIGLQSDKSVRLIIH